MVNVFNLYSIIISSFKGSSRFYKTYNMASQHILLLITMKILKDVLLIWLTTDEGFTRLWYEWAKTKPIMLLKISKLS